MRLDFGVPSFLNVASTEIGAYSMRVIIDRWHRRRIFIAFILATVWSISVNLDEFWPSSPQSSAGHDAASLIVLAGELLLLPAILCWMVSGVISIFRRKWRLLTSNILAIAVSVGCCLAIARLPVFSPWYWYVRSNEMQLITTAMSKMPSRDVPEIEYRSVETRDVSDNFAGFANHFVELIYSDIAGQTKFGIISHLYGNFYRFDQM